MFWFPHSYLSVVLQKYAFVYVGLKQTSLTFFLRDVLHGKPRMIVCRRFCCGLIVLNREDCPGNGVIVGMPPCCDLYISNLPPIEGQSWLVIVWNGTLLVFHKCQGQSNYPTRSQSHLLESQAFHCHDCQHPPSSGGVTRPVWCHDWKVFCK